jgi:hypothetical protein
MVVRGSEGRACQCADVVEWTRGREDAWSHCCVWRHCRWWSDGEVTSPNVDTPKNGHKRRPPRWGVSGQPTPVAKIARVGGGCLQPSLRAHRHTAHTENRSRGAGGIDFRLRFYSPLFTVYPNLVEHPTYRSHASLLETECTRVLRNGCVACTSRRGETEAGDVRVQLVIAVSGGGMVAWVVTRLNRKLPAAIQFGCELREMSTNQNTRNTPAS